MALTAQMRWKEETVITDEVGRTFIFDGGWGVSPPVAYVPLEADWVRCVPDWLSHRRVEVIEAIAATGQVVKEGRYAFLDKR
jgi:hypothetical protein